jgi:hypothetical protein
VEKNFRVALDNAWDWVLVGRTNAQCVVKSRNPQIRTEGSKRAKEQQYKTNIIHSSTTVYIPKIGAQDGS